MTPKTLIAETPETDAAELDALVCDMPNQQTTEKVVRSVVARSIEFRLRALEREGMVPSTEALRIAEQTVAESDSRAQCKVALAVAGLPILADMIDEMVVLAREIIRLSARPKEKP